mmetsp:Transcript_58405/g.153818  ORF Transcript_58405/g.153818 Transcript_58405/m.153818 type:complete len:204 (-) Transcript_58405:287-898(-)
MCCGLEFGCAGMDRSGKGDSRDELRRPCGWKLDRELVTRGWYASGEGGQSIRKSVSMKTSKFLLVSHKRPRMLRFADSPQESHSKKAKVDKSCFLSRQHQQARMRRMSSNSQSVSSGQRPRSVTFSTQQPVSPSGGSEERRRLESNLRRLEEQISTGKFDSVSERRTAAERAQKMRLDIASVSVFDYMVEGTTQRLGYLRRRS